MPTKLSQTREAVWQASFDTGAVADALRRYQKFTRLGQPSPQIVRLRQQRVAAPQASRQARQPFIKGAAAVARPASIAVPPRVALELFIIGWIDANAPKAFAAAATGCTLFAP